MSWKPSGGAMCWTGNRNEMTCQECEAPSGRYSLCGLCGELVAKRTRKDIVWTPEMAADLEGWSK